MSASAGLRKILAFGLLGAAGCLAAWGLGEAVLAATPVEKGATSLVAPPAEADAPVAGATAPPPPGVPGAVPPPPPAPPPPPQMAERLTERKAGTGDIQISLKWDNRNDLDLHCIDPTGFHIHFPPEKRKSPSGGWLDVDRNAGAGLTAVTNPVENVFWKKAVDGEYKVSVRHFKKHLLTPEATKYQVRIKVGNRVELYDGQITKSDPNRDHVIDTFRWPPPDLRLAVPADVSVNQGGKNKLGVKVKRDNVRGPVRIQLTVATTRLSIPEVKLPEGETEAEVVVSATEEVMPATYEFLAEATSEGDKPSSRFGAGEKASAKFDVRVRAVPPSLAVAVPAEVEVYPGGENKLGVRLRRDRFSGPVNLTFGGDADGVAVAGVAVPADADRAEVTLAAGKSARPGVREVVLNGSAPDASATAKFRVVVEEAPASAGAWSWLELLRTAAWTALLATGLAAALVGGQNYFLSKPLINASQVKILLGALLAGAFAGAVGQALYGGLSQAQWVPRLGFVVGWLLLGGLLGRGVAFFIPNLGGAKASAAGAVGGVLASLAFVGLGGEVAGRLIGAVLLGFAIGLMVALVELAFRKAWLEVRYGPREMVTVNLGPEPVKVGGDGRACAVFARGAPPIALRFWLREGKVYFEDVPTKTTAEAPLDRPLTVGSLSLTVRSAMVATPPAAAAPKPAQPAPIAPPRAAPKPAAAPVPAKRGDACPQCGAFVPYKPGQRECVCGHVF